MEQNNEETIRELEERIKSLRPKKEKLELIPSSEEGLLVGYRKNGKKYTVREHRMNFFMPDIWVKFYKALGSDRARLTADVLIQTGARINEVRNIKESDIDYERRTVRLRITKTKAKKGEGKGKPRTIPISSQFTRKLKKHFQHVPEGETIGILSTPAMNIALKKALKDIEFKEWYMLSVHNIRKTHGNWLKVLGDLRIMEVSASEICLRLGHDYNTFLKDYGSSGVMENRDIMIVREILGDLYRR